MICNNCKRELPKDYNKSNCPFCNAPLKKGYRSKYVKSDKVYSAGGNVSSKSFISLKKKNTGKNIELKHYNSFIDYKTAKEKAEKKSKYYNVYSKDSADNFTGAKSSKAKYVDKNKKKQESNTFRNESSSSYRELINPNRSSEPVATNWSSNIQSNNGYENQVVYDASTAVKESTVSIKKVGVNKKTTKLFFVACFAAMLVLVSLFVYKSYANNGYYFGENNTEIVGSNGVQNLENDEMLQYTGSSKSGQVNQPGGVGVTSIVYDNVYEDQLVFNNLDDVLKLIASDSNRQKSNCLQSVVNIENDIIENYGITAVNFCEMDVEFAKELRDVVAYIYDTYPSARGYLTNITVANLSNVTFIAAFMPFFEFGISNTSNGYPVAFKSQIILNAKYFLDDNKIIKTVANNTKSGWFAPNATRSSTVAHEFGHYLSYIALLKHYNSGRLNFVKASDVNMVYKVYDDFDAGSFSYKMLQEAYKKYQNTYRNDTTFLEFRSSISKYAIAKDTDGNYIYDETIAEAFHDCYLNGEMAQPASRMIVEVLLSYL